MENTPRSSNWPDIDFGKALLSSAIRKVPEGDRGDVINKAIAEAWAHRGNFDETKGPMEAWFHGILKNCVRQYFATHKKVVHLPEWVEDEAASCDPGMDEIDVCDFEDWIAKIGAETFRGSPPKVRRAVSMLAQGRSVGQIAQDLGCTPHAAGQLLSRFGREFKERYEFANPAGHPPRYGNRVNVVVIIEVINRRSIHVGTKNMFVTGPVSGGVFGSDNIVDSTVNYNFGRVADGVARVVDVVAADKDVPAGVKARAIECLGDIEAEARSPHPSMDAIRGMIQFLAQVAPPVVAIARALGVPLFA